MSKPPTKTRRWGAGRVAFLNQKDLFRSKLEAGHSLSSIYADHGSDLGISYAQFTRYVGQYLIEKETTDGHQNEVIPGSVSAPPGQPGGPSTGSGSGPALPSPPAPKPQGKVAGKFSHDANSGNDRDDLI